MNTLLAVSIATFLSLNNKPYFVELPGKRCTPAFITKEQLLKMRGCNGVETANDMTMVYCSYIPKRAFLYFPSRSSCKGSKDLIDTLATVLSIEVENR